METTSAHSDAARLSLLGLGQHQSENTVLHLCADPALINPVGEREAAPVVTDIVLGVDRLHALILGKIELALDREHAIFDAHIDFALIDARDLNDQRQGLVSL